ncbi:MAG: hypothetical protein ABEJ73_05075 [Haloplanus sp.]
MGDDRIERRALLGVGAGVLASLAGCGRLFIEPESTTTTTPTTETATTTPEPTPTATATPSPEPTTTPTATAAPLPSEVIEIQNRQLTVRRSRFERFGLVSYRFEVENTGQRAIEYAEFRVRARYDHADISRIVGTAYPRFRFDAGGDDDDTSEESRPGLQAGETDRVRERLRFERDGRANGSTADERFYLELSVRRLRYR